MTLARSDQPQLRASESDPRGGLTHAALVCRAATWLRNTVGCGVVFSEHTAGLEHPDAIGWKWATWSVLVECKVSRADFFADAKKPTRTSYENRPAAHCYYMVPSGLVSPNEVPKGWGLLYVQGRQVRVVMKPHPESRVCDRTKAQLLNELYRLYQEVRRYQIHGLTYPTLPRTGRVQPEQDTLTPSVTDTAPESFSAPSEQET